MLVFSIVPAITVLTLVLLDLLALEFRISTAWDLTGLFLVLVLVLMQLL